MRLVHDSSKLNVTVFNDCSVTRFLQKDIASLHFVGLQSTQSFLTMHALTERILAP
jgi:hypothetical protein